MYHRNIDEIVFHIAEALSGYIQKSLQLAIKKIATGNTNKYQFLTPGNHWYSIQWYFNESSL